MDRIKTIIIPGFIKLSFRNWKEACNIFWNLFIRGEYKFEATNSPPLILDCGSHIGISVLYFKKRFPKAKITAFEPNPNTFSLLKLNVKQNNLKDINLVNAALTNREGEIDFFVSEGKDIWSWGDSAVINKWYNPKTYKTIKVPSVRLSSFIKKRVDLIKLDVEGSEEIVLREISPKLHIVDQIIIEFHGSSTNKQNNLDNILHILDDAGFEYKLNQDWKFISRSQLRMTDPFWVNIYARRINRRI